MIKHYGTQKKMSDNNLNDFENNKLRLDELVGSKYVFPDGDSIQVKEIKIRDKPIDGQGIDGSAPFITYLIQQGPGIPRQLSMFYQEFIDTYGHLFTKELDRE